MIQVRMGQYHGIERRRVKGKRETVTRGCLMRALHQTAIDEDARGAMLEEKA